MTDLTSRPEDHADSQEKKVKEYQVVINGTIVLLDDDTLSYEELANLAFPDHGSDLQFAIKYRNAIGARGGSGILVAGESVRIKKKGTSFDVRLANRS